MNKLQNTYAMKASEIDKRWFVIDAEGKVLGRLASEVAMILRGKNKPTYSPYLDMGDFVVIINAEKIKLTGLKAENKEYFSHSHYPGGLKFTSIKKVLKTKPEFIIQHAVRGMLPKSKIGRKVMNNLKVYSGKEHPHQAQNPEPLNV